MKIEKLNAEQFALTVSNYPDFRERTAEIISDVIAFSPILAELVPMTGVKANHTVDLNILTTNVTWSNADCVATETGDNTDLNPRTVTVKRLTDRELMCLDVLDAKLPMIQKAGARNEELPFAEKFMNLKIEANGKALINAAFEGSITGGTGNLSKVDGWFQIAKDESGSLAHYETFVASAYTQATAIAFVESKILDYRTPEMYAADDMKIFMSLSYASILARALVAAYGANATGTFTNTGNENQNGMMRFNFPGTNVEIIGTEAITSNDILAIRMHDLRYVTDLESDRESVELFYDKYHKQLVSDIVFAIGFQYQFANQVIYLNRV